MIEQQHSSGNLQADRRYAYAQDLLREGDPAAAADLLRQTLELVPDWPAAWFTLGDALEQSREHDAAADAFRRAARLAPSDVLGAAVRLGRLAPVDPAAVMTPGYVAALFDQYAPRFDDHLVGALDYRGPQIIMAALAETCARLGRLFSFATSLDLGCGTGLMARAIGANVEVIDGVDISPAMVRQAVATGLYRQARVADVVEATRATRCALLLAADVLCYMKDLNPLLQAAAQALEPDGLFAFTVQTGADEGVWLGGDMRYHHSAGYITQTAAAAALIIHHLAPCITRRDAGQDVPGLVVVVGRAP